MSKILKVDNIKNTNSDDILIDGMLKNTYIDSSCNFTPSLIPENEFIVSHKFTSSSSVDLSLTSSNGLILIPDTEIDMGIPKKSNNWYRLYFCSIADDQTSSNGGVGFSFYRKVGSGSWERVLGQGIHAHYDNNMGDWYVNADMLAYIPAVNNTEIHQFSVYVHAHSSQWRINCSIGNDYRRDGWNNNIFEITEYDGDKVDNGLFTRY